MELSRILSLITTTAVVTGGIFGGIQLFQLKKQRAKESALQLLHSFQTPEFLRAVNLVFSLPEGLSRKEIEQRLGDNIICVLTLFGTFESLGILIFRDELELRLVEDFFSGVIILTGRKFKRYLNEVRDESYRQTYYEWFQWLYEQVEKRELKTPAVPAYVAFKSWEYKRRERRRIKNPSLRIGNVKKHGWED